jgi:hypothetical protein
MRTTIDIQDDVLQKAREVSARSGVTLSVLVSDALRRSLAEREAPKQPVHLTVYVPRISGVLPGVDITDNASLWEILDADQYVDP